LRCESLHAIVESSRQNNAAWDRPHIMISAPGKFLDSCRRRKTDSSRISFLVIDEADYTLDPSFLPQVEEVLCEMRPDRQVLLFSASYSDDVKAFETKISDERSKYCPGVIRVHVGDIKLSACKHINQQFWASGRGVPGLWPEGLPKQDALMNAIGAIRGNLQKKKSKAIVFVNKKDDVLGVVSSLKVAKLNCEGYTTDVPSQFREELLQKFQDPSTDLSVLVSTDILGRGYDLKNVKYVINYDMPNRLADYIHRIGRTGRAGNRGYALTFLEEADLRFALDLCNCLTDLKCACPRWLEDECKNREKHLKTWKSKCDASDDHAHKLLSDWHGRGCGRRAKFLIELKGLGLARRPGVE